MPIALSAEVEAKINDLIKNGGYPSAEKVILAGLHLLEARQQKAQAWLEWTTKHAVSLPQPADDSRESIYTREDEAL